jgi:hypothetical protein
MPSRKNRSAARKSRKNRLAERKSRKNRSSRKDRKCYRKNRTMMGGMAPVNDTSMTMSQRDSLAQGNQYLNIHKGQYGGAMASPAPYSAVTGSVLSGPMIAAARTGPLDVAIGEIQGMQDGGRRRRRKAHKGGRRSRKAKKHSRRRHRGGAHSGASLSESSMLLPSGLERQAALHNDWATAKNPNAFVPKA